MTIQTLQTITPIYPTSQVTVTQVYLDTAGDLVSPPRVDLHIRPVNGEVTSYASLAPDSTGHYSKALSITGSGRWLGAWLAKDAAGTVTYKTDVFQFEVEYNPVG